MQTNQEIILSIADGQLSVSRIKRIAKALHNVDLTPTEISQVTAEAGIATPHRTPPENPILKDYPDQWSILLEGRSFWVRVRRYWGDAVAKKLHDRLAQATIGKWRMLYEQFAAYTTSGIHSRKNIDFSRPEILLPLELEQFYPWELQRDLYLQAYRQEFESNPDPQFGAKFPLPSEEHKQFKRQQFEQDCLRALEAKFKDEYSLVEYFGAFWKEILIKRGEHYFDRLLNDLADLPSVRAFYGSSEDNFRHFLRNLNGFKATSPWRIPFTSDSYNNRHLPLPMALEGALLKYGWKGVHSFVGLAAVMAQNVPDKD